MNTFFYLDSTCLLNKPKIKGQAQLIYKQTNINELFIEPTRAIYEQLGLFTTLATGTKILK